MKLHRLDALALNDDGTAARRQRNAARHDPDTAAGCFGGDSLSSSSSSTSTTNIDKRQVVDGSSVGVTSDSSTVNVSVLDHGAFADAVALADRAVTETLKASAAANALNSGDFDKVLNLTSSSTKMAGDSLDKVLGFAGSVLKLTGDSAKVVEKSATNISDAYKTAAEISTGQRLVVAGGLVLAGIVAVKSFSKA